MRSIWGREFHLCQDHREKMDLGGKGWQEEWKREWIKEQKDRAQGKIRYPRTRDNRQRASDEIADRIRGKLNKMGTKDLDKIYRDWAETNGFEPGKRALRKFSNFLKSRL